MIDQNYYSIRYGKLDQEECEKKISLSVLREFSRWSKRLNRNFSVALILLSKDFI